MSPRTVVRASVIAVIMLLAALPSNGLGAPPQVFHEKFLNIDNDVDVCGINVDIVNEGVGTERVFFDKQGNFDRFLLTVSGSTTFTADNGKSVVVRFANQILETEVVDEEAGVATVTQTIRGLPEMIKTPHGGVLTRDAGIITFLLTFDLETGDLLSSVTTVVKGPHPEADSDFELFCEVFTEALS